VNDYEPNTLKMILHTTKMLCEKLVKNVEHETPTEIHEIAGYLLKAIEDWKRATTNKQNKKV